MSNNTTGLHPRVDLASDRLRREIEDGLYAENSVLPGERDLAGHLGVSRTTLRRALKVLVTQGLLGQRQGYGTFIRSEVPDIDRPDSTSILSPGDELIARGVAERAQCLTSGRFLPQAREAVALDVPLDQWVTRTTRLFVRRNDEPVAVEQAAMVAKASVAHPPASQSSDTSEGDWECKRMVRYTCAAAYPAHFPAQAHCENTTGMLTEQRGYRDGGRCVQVWQMWQTLGSFDSVVGLPARL